MKFNMNDEEGSAEVLLSNLRTMGWMVAVHNDYRLDGERYTFWLLTRDNEELMQGEGLTDLEALRSALSDYRKRKGVT